MQLEYTQNIPIGRAGMIADLAPHYILSRIANGEIGQGRGVFRVPVTGAPGSTPPGFPGAVWQNPNVSIGADVDAIATALAGAAAADRVYNDANGSFAGVLGGDVTYPARRSTLTLNSHADWNAGDIEYDYVNHLGVEVTEVITVVDAGNATYTTTGYVAQPLEVRVPGTVQSTSNATMTIGYAALDASVTLADFVGIAVGDGRTRESGYPNTDASEDDPVYADKDTVPVMSMGAIWVRTEDACVENGAVYVRIAPNGANVLVGSFRSDADTANAVQVTRARYGRDSSAGGLNIVLMGV